MKATSKLKALLARRAATTLPGAANALFARIIEDQGFEACYVTGAGVANMYLGAPDIGLTTATELADHVARITEAIELPVLVDGDTGFGNALNMRRTVRLLEKAGAAGIQIEDQTFPKRCGHFEGKSVIPLPEMLSKIRAAADARRDGDFQIVARTDSRAIEGIDHAIERARAFVEAGADATFIEAPLNEEELKRSCTDIPAPQFANIVFGGKTPDPGRERLAEMGFAGVLYANAALQAAVHAANEVLAALKRDGTLKNVAGRIATFEERQRSVAKPSWDDLEKKYRS